MKIKFSEKIIFIWNFSSIKFHNLIAYKVWKRKSEEKSALEKKNK